MLPREPHHRSVSGKARVNARRMRREPTKAESTMWRLLRDRRLAAFKFRRQEPFGPYILDFVCYDRHLVIEIDGSQHADSPHDGARDAYLAEAGFLVVRFWNNDVLQRRGSVFDSLIALLSDSQDPSPGTDLRSAPPSPTRGEGSK